MLRFQASERISAEDALHHPYFNTAEQQETEEGEEEGEEEEEEEEEEGYHTPDSTPHTSSCETCSHLDISNSSDSGILHDSCPS